MSLTGAYLYGNEKWYPGTMITLTLQEEAAAGDAKAAASAVSVRCKVIRHDAEGTGVSFIPRTPEEQKALKGFMNNAIAKTGGGSTAGQALVEYAFMVPFLVLLIVNCVNFGVFLYDWIAVANAARAGAQYAILGGASAGSLTPATGAQVKTVVTNDMASLPGTPTVSVCTNNNGTLGTLTGSCSLTTTPADPEAPYYVLATVDVTYTYTPVTGALTIPRLGIHATIPPTSIHRQVVMRLLQ